MTLHRSMPETVTSVCAQVRTVLVGLPFVLLFCASAPLFGQQATTYSLERGDRVRVWRSEAGWTGRQFDFRERIGDTLVLMEPDTIGVTRLSLTEIEKLQLERTTGGTHLLEGALIGGGVGIVPIAILSARECSGPDYQGGVGCTIEFMMEGPILLGLVPGALLGGAIGLVIPEREWISIETGPPIQGGRAGCLPEERRCGSSYGYRLSRKRAVISRNLKTWGA